MAERRKRVWRFRLVPDSAYADPADRENARVVAVTIVAGVVMLVIFSAWLILTARSVAATSILAVHSVVVLAGLVCLRRGRRLSSVVNSLALSVTTTIVMLSLLRGGFRPGVLIWLALAPMVLVKLGFARSAGIWLGISLVFSALLAGYAVPLSRGVFGVAEPPEVSVRVGEALSLGSLAITLFALALSSRHAEAALAESRIELERQLAQRDRLASLGTLAAGVAHELNNPLAYIQANTAFASERLGDPQAISEADRQEIRDALADALDGCARSAKIISALSTYTRDVPATGTANVLQSVSAALRVSGPQVSQTMQVSVDVSETLEVQMGAQPLTQVFTNLFVNSAQAVTGSGRVRGRLWVRARRGDGLVELIVEDDGPGFAREAQARAFEPFFTTKDVGEGTGLGLSIVGNLVERADGSIHVEAREGGGARIRLELVEAHRAAEAPPSGPAKKGGDQPPPPGMAGPFVAKNVS